MGLFPVLIFVIELAFLNAAAIPVPDTPANTFYDALQTKCPLVKDIPDFRKQKIFEKCSDWKKIDETQSLTEDTANNFLCLLYFDSLSSFCLEIAHYQPQLKPANVGAYFMPTVTENNVEIICNKTSLFPPDEKFEHNITQWLRTDVQCTKVCSNYDGTPKIECSLAYYFANLYIKLVAPKNSAIPVSNPNKAPEQNTQHLDDSQQPHDQEQHDTNPGKPNAINEGQHVNADEAISGVHAQDKVGQPPNDEVHNVIEVPNKEPSGAAPISLSDAVAPNTVLHSESKGEAGAAKPDLNAAVAPDKSSDIAPANNASDKSQPSSTNGKASIAQSETNKNEEETLSKTKPENTMPLKENEAERRPETDMDGNPIDTGMEMEAPFGPDEQQFGNADDSHEEVQQDQDIEVDEPQDTKAPGAIKKLDKNEKEKIDDEKVNAGQGPSANGEDTKQDTKKETAEDVVLPDNIPISSANGEDIDGESYFFSYFMAVCILFVLGYVGYHNRQKVMALVVEGKRGKRQFRGRRPNSANYHKLDSNLEEAISSSCTKNSSHVIY